MTCSEDDPVLLALLAGGWLRGWLRIYGRVPETNHRGAVFHKGTDGEVGPGRNLEGRSVSE